MLGNILKNKMTDVNHKNNQWKNIKNDFIKLVSMFNTVGLYICVIDW
jgi:hypothetical protein